MVSCKLLDEAVALGFVREEGVSPTEERLEALIAGQSAQER